MSDRQLSKRSKRRLRSKVAVLVARKVPHTSDQPPRDRSPSPSVIHPGLSSSDRSPSPSVHAAESMSNLPLSASVTGSLSDQSPVHTMSSDRSLSASDDDCMESARESDHVSEERNYSSDDLGDVSSKEGSSSVSISESLSNVSEDESETEVGGQAQPQDTSPLFPQAHVSAEEFEVAFMSLVQRHNLTYASQSDLLRLFSIVLPPPNMVPSSSHVLVGKFINYEKDVVTSYYCGSCLSVMQKDTACVNSQCSNKGAQRAVFVRISLAMQLKERFEDPDFYKLLQHRFCRARRSGVLSDIYDASEYAKHSSYFESKYNLSFALNFDGAPKFKSSSVQLWPIQLYLNELPPALRASREHMFLGGIWCSSSKPPTVECLMPVLQELESLHTVGVKVNVKGEGETICRARLLFVVADLPAKASLLNIIQFNGKFGCPSCYHEGVQVSIGRGRTRAYGYQSTTLRKDADHSEHAHKAETENKIIYGVKGKSVFHTLTDFGTINNVPVDYMHCVLLGVVRLLISLWFDSKYHKEPWYIGNRVAEVEERLRLVKPPDLIGRIPKAFRGRGWKATECRTFLLYYLPILKGILPDLYLAHVFLLSKSIRILLSDEILVADIDFAESLLLMFWRLTEKYYGLKYCKMNIHLLSHLPHYVKLFGPLWTHSAFAFEDSIGHLVKKAHGTHDIANQIVTSFILQWRLHVQRKLIHGTSSLMAFLSSTTSRQTQRMRPLTISVSSVGMAKNIMLESEDEEVVLGLMEKCSVHMNSDRMVTFHPKLIINQQEISSKRFSRVQKRNNCTVAYTSLGELKYGRVKYFITCPADASQAVHVAVINEFHVQELLQLNYPPELKSLDTILSSDFVYVLEGSKAAVPVEQIVMKCAEISVMGRSLVTTLVGRAEVAK